MQGDACGGAWRDMRGCAVVHGGTCGGAYGGTCGDVLVLKAGNCRHSLRCVVELLPQARKLCKVLYGLRPQGLHTALMGSVQDGACVNLMRLCAGPAASLSARGTCGVQAIGGNLADSRRLAQERKPFTGSSFRPHKTRSLHESP